MLKRLILLFFLFISLGIFSQEKNSISISPPSMTATSSILIQVEKKGLYTLKMLDFDNKVLFTKKLDIKNIMFLKHNFSPYKKGKYYFSLERNNKEILKTLKTK